MRVKRHSVSWAACLGATLLVFETIPNCALAVEEALFEVAQPVYTGNELKVMRVVLSRDVGLAGTEFEANLTAVANCIQGVTGSEGNRNLAHLAGIRVTAKPMSNRRGLVADTMHVLVDSRSLQRKTTVETYDIGRIVEATVLAVRVNAYVGSKRQALRDRPSHVAVSVRGPLRVRGLGGVFAIGAIPHSTSFPPGQ